MLGAMHMPPPPSNLKKPLSLRERMTLQKPSRPHAPVCNPDAQHIGLCQAAPQTDSRGTISQPQTEQLPRSAISNPPTSAGSGGHGCPPPYEAGIQVQGMVKSAATRPGQPKDFKRPAVVQSLDGLPGNEGTDDDMTQEDMPIEPMAACVELPSLGAAVPQQPSPQQSKSTQQAQSESGLRQPQARREGSAELNEDTVEGDCADDDDEARWEQALEAEMQGLPDRAEENVSRQGCRDAEVIQLDVESADDLLDVLADAAAETSPSRYTNHAALSGSLNCHGCMYQQ